MPRGAKTIKRQIVNAGIEYKKGNRKEAYQLWAKAADGRKEKYEGKHFKKKRAEDAAAAEKAAAAIVAYLPAAIREDAALPAAA